MKKVLKMLRTKINAIEKQNQSIINLTTEEHLFWKKVLKEMKSIEEESPKTYKLSKLHSCDYEEFNIDQAVIAKQELLGELRENIKKIKGS